MPSISHPTEIQGVKFTDLAAQFGTPLYVYDADSIKSQFDILNNAFSKDIDVRIKYAAKALTNVNILRWMRKIGAGLDVVSIQEARIGMKAGYLPDEIMYTPNGVAFEEIEEAVNLGLMINLDSLSFLELFGQKYGASVPLCIRVNPHVEAGGNEKIKTGHAESKFGISIEQIQEVYRLVEKHQMKIAGVHVHTGSDFGDVEVFLTVAEVIFGAASHFQHLKFLDFGSGFKVAYKAGDKVTDMKKLGEKMSQAFKKFCERYGRPLELWFEPGKFLVSESGYLLSKVNVVKETPATTFIGVDSGLNHLIRPMMYGSYHEIYNVSNPSGELKEYSVVGYICETDTFGWGRKISETQRGDIMVFKNAGAYGFSMSSNYNSRFRPAEVLVHQGKALLIRKRETMEDVMRTQVDIEL
jgi:diaminopimelate decarboxylase